MDFEALFKKRANHIKPGLERIRRSYEALGEPARGQPSVLIGGTNGKGSTSGFLWALLAASGQPVGLFSSPHLIEFSERFQISGRTTSETDVHAAWAALQSELPADLYEELSFFEIATLIAFRMFADQRVVLQVLEVGLGGRWDSTNVSDPMISLLVSVSVDHKEFLGSDLSGILREKLGITRPGRPLFWGDQGEILEVPDHRAIIETHCEEGRIPLYVRGREFWDKGDAIHIRLPGLPTVELPLGEGISAGLPDYLRRNLSLSAAAYHWIAETKGGWPALASIWPNFLQGTQRAPLTLVGRAQRLTSRVDGRPWLIDVCHNPDGARAFAASVLRRGQKMPALVSVLKDKDYDSVLDILRSALHPVILFGIESERSWQQANLAERHRDLTFHASLEEAMKATETSSEAWAICGSVAAVGLALERMKVSPKELSLASIINGEWTSPSQ